MAVPRRLCSITIQITAMAGEILPEPITLIANITFPKVNGIVSVDILGVTLEIPCPSIDLEKTINVPGIGEVTLLIQAEQV